MAEAIKLKYHRKYMRSFQVNSDDFDREKVQYKDHYQLLGLDRNATHVEVRRKYKELALQFHPDRNSSEIASRQWEGVPAAYAVLSDPNARLDYDASLPVRDALALFYQQHNPGKLTCSTIDTIMESWGGRQVELFEMLHRKYEIRAYKEISTDVPESLPHERSQKIRCDSLSSPAEKASVSSGFTKKMLGAVCCESVAQKCIASTYYEVHGESPGLENNLCGAFTPGQAPKPSTPKFSSCSDDEDSPQFDTIHFPRGSPAC